VLSGNPFSVGGNAGVAPAPRGRLPPDRMEMATAPFPISFSGTGVAGDGAAQGRAALRNVVSPGDFTPCDASRSAVRKPRARTRRSAVALGEPTFEAWAT
jgi:hypothetical protein